MKRKHIIPVFLCLYLILVFCEPAFATETVETESTGITVLYDGTQIPFDVQPIVFSGRTMVPFRAIFEKLGYTVDYDNNTKIVSALKGSSTISLVVGSDEIHCGDTVVQSDVASIIQSNRTLVPVRTIAELSGCDVLWDANTQTVLIYHKQAENYSPVTFTYMPMACDGKNLYTNLWNKNGIEVTSQISLSDCSVQYLPFRWLNDYMLYGGKLYGRYGLKTNHSYGAYDPSTGKAQDISGSDVANCYIYKDQIYYIDFSWGPYKATLRRMNLDGTNRIELFSGSDNYPIGNYAIYDGLYFCGYQNSLYAVPLNTLEPIDLLSLAGINADEVVVCDMAIYGDCFYAALEEYYGEDKDSGPFGILQYNYKSWEYKYIPLNYIVGKLIVTDNSIFTLALREDNNKSYDLYRSTLDGSYPVLLERNIDSALIMYGNYIFLSDLAGTGPSENYKSSLIQIATDGTQRKVLLTYS